MALADMLVKSVANPPRRIMIYGVGGIGKTTFAASADRPIFIQTEDGLNDVCRRMQMEVPRFPICESYETVLQQIGVLLDEDHEYRTLAVDSVDWLETLIHARICKEKEVESIDKVSWGKGYLAALNDWTDILTGLDMLVRKRGMNVILIGHTHLKQHNSPLIAEQLDRYVPKLDKRTMEKLVEWCDDVLFAVNRIDTRQVSKPGEMRERHKGIDRGRVLITQEQPGVRAKNRCGLPAEMPFTETAWREYAAYAFADTVERSTS